MKRILYIWITAALICGPLTAVAQHLGGVVSITPPSSSVQPAMTLSSGGDSAYQSTFRKDPLITIRQEEAENSQLENRIFSIKSVWELFDTADIESEKSTEDEKRNVLELFYSSFAEELHSDPFYHVGRDTPVDTFIYDEQAWDALARTLRKKFKFVRELHRTAADLEKFVTVKYETEASTVFRLRPGVESINGQEYIIIRLGIRTADENSSLDTRLSERGAKVRMGTRLRPNSNQSSISLEYEAIRTDDEEIEEKWEQVSQVCLTVPLW